jgi:hypothetical protein
MSPGYIFGGAGYTLSHVDEMIDELLTTDYSCDIALPRVPKRWTLEAAGQLEPRRSALEDEEEEEEEKEEEEAAVNDLEAMDIDKDRRRSRSPIKERDREKERDRDRHRDYRFVHLSCSFIAVRLVKCVEASCVLYKVACSSLAIFHVA